MPSFSVEGVFLLFDTVSFVRCVCEFSEGWTEVLGTTFSTSNWGSVGMSGFFSFRPWVFPWKEMRNLCFGFLISSDSSRTSTGEGCLFLLESRASDFAANNKK